MDSLHRLFIIALCWTTTAVATPETSFQIACGTASALAGQQTVVKGTDGWVFLKAELDHLAAGPFWGEAALAVSKAAKDSSKDPLPAIVDYNNRLKELGVTMIFLPVPNKAVIYPDKLPGDFTWNPSKDSRVDNHHEQFYALLREQGVKVLDPVPLLLKARKEQDNSLYCLRDSHYSGTACELIATELGSMLIDEGLISKGATSFSVRKQDTRIVGDLVEMAGLTEDVGAEKLPLQFVSGEKLKDKQSPVLLFGDSHTLVFDIGGDMHSNDAGLASHLAHQLGMGIDVEGVFGSGATPSRINIYRRFKKDPESIKAKKVFIWCLTATEFTEGSGWSAKIPIIKK